MRWVIPPASALVAPKKTRARIEDLHEFEAERLTLRLQTEDGHWNVDL